MEGVTVEALCCGTTDFPCLLFISDHFAPFVRCHTVQSSHREETAIVNYGGLAATTCAREEIRLTLATAKAKSYGVVNYS